MYYMNCGKIRIRRFDIRANHDLAAPLLASTFPISLPYFISYVHKCLDAELFIIYKLNV